MLDDGRGLRLWLEAELGGLEQTIPGLQVPQLAGQNVGQGREDAQDTVRRALRHVIDPEVRVNVFDLDLMRETTRNGRGIETRMVLTSPARPAAGYLVQQVRRKARQATDGEPAEVVLLDEAWRWEHRAPHLRPGEGI